MLHSQNYYEILNAEQNASFEELKIKYKKMILQYHPDKNEFENHAKCGMADGDQHDNIEEVTKPQRARQISHDPTNKFKTNKFLKITEAWNTLKDEEKRKKYDACLLLEKLETHSNVFAEVNLKDMERHDGSVNSMEDSEPFFTLNCRCGGQYIFDEDMTETPTKTMIECSECSLVIVLNC